MAYGALVKISPKGESWSLNILLTQHSQTVSENTYFSLELYV